ncbi:MAG: disulfide bond formation protein B [Candidatus Pelagibacterales bacterium]|jgi:disulfide bond formation protein DsbB|tara:strand:+ start:1903 stop:2388 length:486 start_codon:yes stop_codon:yes gene_type:complete
MKIILIKNYIIINLAIALIALVAVYILQYLFGLAPCEMCIKERYPYYLIGIIAFVSVCVNFQKSLLLTITKITYISLSLIGFLYATYHVGIERKLWVGKSGCSGNSMDLNIEALSTQLLNAPIVRCDEPTVLLSLISIAELNALVMLGLLILNITALYKRI